MIAVCCTRRASICDARDNSLRDFHGSGPCMGSRGKPLCAHRGDRGTTPPGASAACHLTPTCFETQVRATAQQHLLSPALEPLSTPPQNFLLARTSHQKPAP